MVGKGSVSPIARTRGPGPHIGTLREKSLHASLKRWYARAGDRVEVRVDRYVIDLVRDDLLIEVQTSGFSSMRRKVRSLLDDGHRVRIVHPIPACKWIVKLSADGAVQGRRRSPRRGAPVDVFPELVSFPDLVAHPKLEIDLLLTHEEEVRRPARNRSWRRRGMAVVERRLSEVVETVAIRSPSDLARMLPADLPHRFTTADLAAHLRRPRELAQQMAYCLRKADVIAPDGKCGNAVWYRFAGGATPA